MAPSAPRGRAKRVTDPLNDKVKALLRGDECRLEDKLSGSSGSEHDAEELSGFVDGLFFSNEEEDDVGGSRASLDDGEDEESAGSDEDRDRPSLSRPVAAMLRDLLKPAKGDRFRRDLVAHVTEAVESLGVLRANPPAFRRAVVWRMRQSGYNAGVCESRWGSHGGVTAGSYEYIDVLVSSPSDEAPATSRPHGHQPQRRRYIVDVDFAGEFEIARPTAEYERASAELPRVFVGRPDELTRLLRLVADAGKRSLRSREMHVPPWRRGSYMRAKWLGPYRRTVDPAPTSPPSSSVSASVAVPPRWDAQWRCIGFDSAASLLVRTPAARTR